MTRKTYFSVELEANSWNDDTFCGTFEECQDYMDEYGYNDASGETARIALIKDDGDPLVTALYNYNGKRIDN